MKIYNTLSRKKEEFKPIKKEVVGLYTCGPTVYNFAHIGNFRAYITADVLQRFLKFSGLKVKWIMNITDVDDKTIRDSKKEFPKLEPKDALIKFTRKYEKVFWQDLEKLNIDKKDFTRNPRATDTITEMQDLVLKILDKGYGYIKDGSVYFDVKKYAKKYKYGQLLEVDMGGFKAGARIDADEYEKENVQDFVLWKGAKEGEPTWDFKIKDKNLAGRPGWHIECSAMSEKDLGKKFDIHTGGIDLKFPHHENEIAQSTIGYGTTPVNVWLHNEYLLVDGGKMSKSKGNFYTLTDLEKKGFDVLALRYLNLLTSYRMPLNFTWKSLEAAGNALNNLQRALSELPRAGQVCKVYLKKFKSALEDDLDTARALGVVWQLVKDPKKDDAKKKATLLEFDKVLGLGLGEVKKIEIPASIKKLAGERDRARKEKDFKKADKVRKEIKEKGFGLEDARDGVKIVKL